MLGRLFLAALQLCETDHPGKLESLHHGWFWGKKRQICQEVCRGCSWSFLRTRTETWHLVRTVSMAMLAVQTSEPSWWAGSNALPWWGSDGCNQTAALGALALSLHCCVSSLAAASYRATRSQVITKCSFPWHNLTTSGKQLLRNFQRWRLHVHHYYHYIVINSYQWS